MKAIMILFFTLFSFLTIAQDLTEVQKQQLDVNYLINGGFENGKAGWSTYNDGASASPVDGVGGTANITLTTTTTLPHEGKVSGVLTKDAVNRQGQGIKRDFLIPDIAKGKVVRLKFSYEITSGTYASGDTSVWIYDVTNSRLIQPNAYTIENSGLKESKFVEFQSSIDSNSYRLIIHVTSTSASAYTLKFDSFGVGLGPKVFGSVVTGWKEFTPTFTGFGTVTNIKAFWRRSGENLEVYGRATSGVPVASGATINFSSLGVVIDTTKVVSDASKGQVAGTFARDAVNGEMYSVGFASNYTNFVYVARHSQLGGLRDSDGQNILGSSEKFAFSFTVPIQGWSTTQQLSSDNSGRIITAKLYRSGSNQTVASGAEVKVGLNTALFDDVGGFDPVNNRYVVKEAGRYRVSASVMHGANPTGVRTCVIYKNGAEATRTQIVPPSANNSSATANDIIDLKVGDYLEVYANQTSGGNLDISQGVAYTFMSIERISGPSQIASSESVSVRYTQSSGQSIVNSGTAVDIIWNNKVYDSHNALNISTGVFTAPTSGNYRVDSGIRYASNAWTSGNEVSLILNKNGSTYSIIGDQRAWASISTEIKIGGSDTVKLLQGETIKIQTLNTRSGGSTVISNNAVLNYVSIERVGNY